MIKCTTHDEGWTVYHRNASDTPESVELKLDSDSQATSTSGSYWNDTAPTATHFSLKNSGRSNDSGKDYVAYLFAGGESSASEAVSVDFDASGESLTIADSGDFNFGSGDFTMECWVNFDQTETGALIGLSLIHI